MRPILLLCLLAAMSSCGNKGSHHAETKQTKDTSKVESRPAPLKTKFTNEDFSATIDNPLKLEKDLSNIVEFNYRTNEFILKIKSKRELPEKTSVICKTLEALGEHSILRAEFNPKTNSAEMLFLMGNEAVFSALYDCKISHQGKQLGDIQVTAYKTVFVVGEQTVSELSLNGTRRIRSLVFHKDAVLITEGKKLNLIADEIISNSGTILTYPDYKENTAKKNTPGQTPEPIILSANRAYGTLRIELRGENGGENTFVPNPITKKKPRGRDGLKGTSFENPSCNGGPGENGFPGTQGSAGHPGGDSGSLVLRLQEFSNFDLAVLHFPGLGGKGGVGGKGGPKGAGGKAGTQWGKYWQELPCKKGRDGKDGEQGKIGDTGRRGSILTSTLVLGSESEIKYVQEDMESLKQELSR